MKEVVTGAKRRRPRPTDESSRRMTPTSTRRGRCVRRPREVRRTSRPGVERRMRSVGGRGHARGPPVAAVCHRPLRVHVAIRFGYTWRSASGTHGDPLRVHMAIHFGYTWRSTSGTRGDSPRARRDSLQHTAIHVGTWRPVVAGRSGAYCSATSSASGQREGPAGERRDPTAKDRPEAGGSGGRLMIWALPA